ncbi:hypothetical protein EVAR_28035_1 [Eumeta japonica]|uniref:Uncharacterized protein n=1 Tax=Eumeta variegata TaxID=151549 RepID=A0A4C1W8K1_EUMVA|nr:hypothetical protein EVAR_28035_1 [Eumeta japonica]
MILDFSSSTVARCGSAETLASNATVTPGTDAIASGVLRQKLIGQFVVDRSCVRTIFKAGVRSMRNFLPRAVVPSNDLPLVVFPTNFHKGVFKKNYGYKRRTGNETAAAGSSARKKNSSGIVYIVPESAGSDYNVDARLGASRRSDSGPGTVVENSPRTAVRILIEREIARYDTNKEFILRPRRRSYERKSDLQCFSSGLDIATEVNDGRQGVRKVRIDPAASSHRKRAEFQEYIHRRPRRARAGASSGPTARPEYRAAKFPTEMLE